MIYRIVLLLIFISISQPAYGQDLIQRLFQESEFELARIELYKLYDQADSVVEPKTLAAIAYAYQLEDKHLKAKTLYRRVLQKSDLLADSYIDSIKTNLCFSLIELSEFGSAYGLFSKLENQHIIPVKQRFFILTAERPSELNQDIFSAEEIESIERFAEGLKNPRKAAILSPTDIATTPSEKSGQHPVTELTKTDVVIYNKAGKRVADPRVLTRYGYLTARRDCSRVPAEIL